MPIAILNKDEKYLYFRSICLCSSSDCDLDVSVSIDNDNVCELSLETKITANEEWGNGNSNFLWWRLKTAAKILFSGYLTAGQYIMMSGDDLKKFVELINEAKDHIEKNKKPL